MMEFMTGVKKKETKEITELLTGCAEGEVVKINGAVHVIRDIGRTVAFVILRKSRRTSAVCI